MELELELEFFDNDDDLLSSSDKIKEDKKGTDKKEVKENQKSSAKDNH